MGTKCLKCGHIHKKPLHKIEACENCGNADRDEFIKFDKEDLHPRKGARKAKPNLRIPWLDYKESLKIRTAESVNIIEAPCEYTKLKKGNIFFYEIVQDYDLVGRNNICIGCKTNGVCRL